MTSLYQQGRWYNERVSFQVAGHQTEGYHVSTEVYEGPLDLLLQLIERAELDITRLALAQVTDQYLAYLQGLKERNAAEVSAFLVIAARLVQIKSAALLPRPALARKEDEEEDPGEALARQLILYKRFKELGAWLEARDAANLHSYLRVSAPPRMEPRLDMAGITLDEITRIAFEVFMGGPLLPALSEVVSAPRVTIREKIHAIIDYMRQQSSALTFQNFLTAESTRLEIVVTFLAMLELIKRHIVEASQESLFSEIALTRQGEWEEPQEGDLEFE